jgi:KaiC/GvpD/RAD55 family RecA-like ATPase
MKQKRISTGVEELDRLIEGGFPAGKSYLIVGPSGTGKSIFCMQFVMKGLLDGEKAVYVCVDEKPSDIVEAAGSLGWDWKKHIDDKSLLILEASAYFSARLGSSKEKEVDVQKIVSDLGSYVKRMGATRLVIDPVKPLVEGRESARTSQEHVRTLVHTLQNNLGTTNLLTTYPLSGSAESPEEHLVAGVVVLDILQQQGRWVRSFMVRKMHATPVELVQHPFNIERGKGIVLNGSM